MVNEILDNSTNRKETSDNNGEIEKSCQVTTGELGHCLGMGFTETTHELMNLANDGYYRDFSKILNETKRVFDAPISNEIAKKATEDEQPASVINNLTKFKGLDCGLAKIWIDKGCAFEVSGNLASFQGLDSETANKLIDAGYGYVVIDNKESFQGLDDKTLEKLQKIEIL